MCFGVRDAIALALDHARFEPLTILGDLVHNDTVLAELRDRGIRIAQQPGEVQTRSAMITAHGASERAIAHARSQGLLVTEATCPLVHLAHKAIQRLVQDRYHPIIIGKRDHVEVRGLTEDLPACDIVLTADDVLALQPRERFGIIAQTTQPIDRVHGLVDLIHRRFPEAEVKFVDTVCQPTKQRQSAAVALAKQSDVVIVIGGAHSNNTHELVKTCLGHCPKVYHVQTQTNLRPEWFAGVRTVGLTAGTSTPDSLIDAVERWLQEFATTAHLQAA
jgi:4-hydroxy-3-methylbut-2-enyl diphosphate reductase